MKTLLIFFCLVLLASLPNSAIGPQPASAQEYEVTDLGALGDVNTPWSVNSLGQVAGYSRLSDGHGDYHNEGFFYDGNTVDYIGTPFGASASDLLGINDLGEAVGKAGRGVYSTGDAIMRRANGSVRRLGTLGGSRAGAKSTNESSQVVGWSQLPGDAESRAFLWEDGDMVALPLLGGTQASAYGINNAGQIVGSSTTDTGGLMQFAVIWDGGEVTQLPPVYESMNNSAYHIHDDGSIVGRIRVPAPGGNKSRGVIWRNGAVDLVLGTLADGTPQEPYASSVAYAINAHGEVVGMSSDPLGQWVPFVYREGTMYRLDDLMPEPWIAVFVGSGCINDLGQITVKAVRTDEPFSYALLLTPLTPAGLADDLDAGEGINDHGYYLATRGHRITYGIARSELVMVSLFDVRGRLVARLVNEDRPVGKHEVVWNGRTVTGRRAASGVYFVRLTTPGFTASNRLTLVR
jgi:probable HAF family extracellular repeat protein